MSINNNVARRSGRRIGSAVVGLTATTVMVLALTACSGARSDAGRGGLTGTGTASAAPSDQSSPGTGASSGTPTAGATSTSTSTGTGTGTTHPYPSNYPRAILTAWKAHDTAYLTLLTSATTASQLFGYGNINQTWTGLTPEGAAGSTFSQFYNNAGDWINLQTNNESTSEHKWHAGRVGQWDKMTFPSDPVLYAKHFISAWLDGNVARMKLLSNSSLTNTFRARSSKPSPDFTATGDGAAGHTYVTVQDTSTSFQVTLAVVNLRVGHSGAIESCYAGC